MEFTLVWFWIVKLVALGLIAGSAYGTYQYKSKTFGVLTVLLIVIYIITPIKLELETRTMQVIDNNAIKESKVIPPKVEDTSFSTSVTSVQGVTEEDLK